MSPATRANVQLGCVNKYRSQLDILEPTWRKKKFLCGESSLTCGHCLTNGADDLWLLAKLSPWDMEAFRKFDEPAGFHEKPLPKGYARSLMETLRRDVFGGWVGAGKTLLSAIPSYWSRWIV